MNSILTPNYVRFNGERPQPLRVGAAGGFGGQASGEKVKKSGGLLDLFLSGLTKTSNKVKEQCPKYNIHHNMIHNGGRGGKRFVGYSLFRDNAS